MLCQKLGRWNLTEDFWLEYQDNACGNCGSQCCPWIGFLAKTLVFLGNYTNHASYWFSYHPGLGDGPLEAAVLRGTVVPHGNNDESENLATRMFSEDLFSGCILLTPLSLAPQGQMCGESVGWGGGGGGNTDTSVCSFRIHIVSWESSLTSYSHIVCYTCGQIGTFYPDTGVACT